MTKEKYLERLRFQCSKREYCISDIRKKIMGAIRSGSLPYPESLSDELLSSLIEDGYLDDMRYARAYASDKSSLDGWGPLKIRMGLASKGIPSEIIDKAVGETDVESAKAKLDRLLSVKYRSVSGEPDCRLRMLKYALGRGYEYDAASEAVDRVMSSEKYS